MKKLFIYLAVSLFSIVEIAAQSCTGCGNTTNTGSNSSAIGTNTISTANSSFASGFGSEATANYTTALGFFAKATYTKGIALGSAVKATMDKSVVIGSGEWNADIYLVNSIPRSLMVGFRSHYPTLFVGESPGYYQTGQVVIGNRFALQLGPQAKLHIKADEGEEAAVLIEPHDWSNGDTATLKLGNAGHCIAADSATGMVYQTQEYHVFKGGDVYISDIGKGIIMKSPDGRCWRGVLDNNGTLNFTVLEQCPGETVSSVKNNGMETGYEIKVYPNPAGDFVTVVLPTYAGSKTVRVDLFDENGRQLLSKSGSGASIRLYMGDLTPGIYFVKVRMDGKSFTQKVIKR